MHIESLLATLATLPQLRWVSLVCLGIRLLEGTIYRIHTLHILLDRCLYLERLIFDLISVTKLPVRFLTYSTLQTVSVVFDMSNVKDNPYLMLVLPNVALFQIILDFNWLLKDTLMSQRVCETIIALVCVSSGVAECTYTL